MKPRSLLFIILLLFYQCSPAQSTDKLSGSWQGVLNVGVELRLVFHIKTIPSGGYLATADSPDQGAYGLKCDTAYLSNGTITIEMHDLDASFSGKLINDSTLEGTFVQRASFPLVLKKTEKITEKQRPQTPKPPFPYESYDVEYDNANKTVHFGATLTVPRPDPNIKYIKAPEYPVAILITGSGQQDRDETILGHKPFAVIADHLTRNGFAVLRVDDRGMGKTKGDVYHATSADLAKDVQAGIDYLKTRHDIDKNRIGLIGHSEGGMIAPMVAVERKDIKFVILLAGPGIKIFDLMAEQNAAILRSAGIDDQSIQDFIPIYKQITETIVQSKDSLIAITNAKKKLADWFVKAGETTKKALGFTDAASGDKYITDLVPEMYSPWFRYFLAFDPQPYLQKLDCKVLALNGSKDVQVISGSNLAGIRASLEKSKTKDYEIKEMPGLNHLFQTCKRCTVTEYGELEETFSPEVLRIMSDWLKNIK